MTAPVAKCCSRLFRLQFRDVFTVRAHVANTRQLLSARAVEQRRDNVRTARWTSHVTTHDYNKASQLAIEYPPAAAFLRPLTTGLQRAEASYLHQEQAPSETTAGARVRLRMSRARLSEAAVTVGLSAQDSAVCIRVLSARCSLHQCVSCLAVIYRSSPHLRWISALKRGLTDYWPETMDVL